MTDREKVIEHITDCVRIADCQINHNWVFVRTEILKDVLAMLKAQEPPKNALISSAIECLLHPQDADDSDMAQAIDTAVRAMRLLKAQEPIVPIRCSAHAQGADDVWYECGKCHKFLGVSRYSKQFCANCGKAVKWE